MRYWPFSPAAQRKALRSEARSIAGSLALMLIASILVLLIIGWTFKTDFVKLLTSLAAPLLTMGGWLTLVNGAMPLWLSAMAFSVPLQVGFYNIGAEGQIMVGGFVTSICGLGLVDAFNGSVSESALWASCLFTGLGCAAAWSLIAWFLKTRFRANEVITTLLLNFVAAIVVNYVVNIPRWTEAGAQGMQTKHLPAHAQFLILSNPNGPSLSLMFILAMCFLVAVHILVWWSRPGLSLRAVGHNAVAAQFCGVNDRIMGLQAVALGGVAAGLVGASFVLSSGSFYADKVSGWGFEGIAVAILGRHKLPGILVAGLVLALWRNLGVDLQIRGIPVEVYLMVQAIFLLVFLKSAKREIA